MEPKLARRIIEYGCKNQDKHPPLLRIAGASSRLLHICDKFSQYVEDLTITFANEDLISTLYETVENRCPNLKRLEICLQTDEMNNFDDKIIYSASQFAISWPKLTSVKILDMTGQARFLQMTQCILYSTPNLKYFCYHGKKYPDLSQNLNVKRIKVDLRKMRASEIPCCNGPHGLNKMLDQVKDRLQVLCVQNDMFDDDLYNDSSDDDMDDDPIKTEAGRIAFKIPKMKNLKEFRNERLDAFSCGANLQDICAARLPALETLEISKLHHCELDDLLRNIIQKKGYFSGVKVLHLSCVRDPELIIRLKTPFPNLENLTIVQFGIDENVPFTNVGTVLRSCNSLGLKSLTLDVSIEDIQLSNFIQCFSNCEKLLISMCIH